jgi:hypothetical protein
MATKLVHQLLTFSIRVVILLVHLHSHKHASQYIPILHISVLKLDLGGHLDKVLLYTLQLAVLCVEDHSSRVIKIETFQPLPPEIIVQGLPPMATILPEFRQHIPLPDMMQQLKLGRKRPQFILDNDKIRAAISRDLQWKLVLRKAALSISEDIHQKTFVRISFPR